MSPNTEPNYYFEISDITYYKLKKLLEQFGDSLDFETIKLVKQEDGKKLVSIPLELVTVLLLNIAINKKTIEEELLAALNDFELYNKQGYL